MNNQFSWNSAGTASKGSDMKVKVVVAALGAASPMTVGSHAIHTPMPVASAPFPHTSGGTAFRAVHSPAMAAAPSQPSVRPITLSKGTWMGIAAIAVPTILALIAGVWGIFDVRSGLKELEGEMKAGFEKVDEGIVLVRERVSRLEGAQAQAVATPPQSPEVPAR